MDAMLKKNLKLGGVRFVPQLLKFAVGKFPCLKKFCFFAAIAIVLYEESETGVNE